MQIRGYYVVLILLVLAFAGTGCVRPFVRRQHKYLITTQKVKGHKLTLTEQLEILYQQKPNRKVLGQFPYLWVWYQGRKHYDSLAVVKEIQETVDKYDEQIAEVINRPGYTEKDSLLQRKLENKKDKRISKLTLKQNEGNYLMRVVGEPPIYYDSTMSSNTRNQLRSYLYNKGFFDAQVTYQTDTVRGYRIVVRYNIYEGQRRKMDNIRYVAEDTNIRNIVLASQQRDALIKNGQYFDTDLQAQEWARLEKLLRNNGYYNFTRRYIEFINDTAKSETHQVDLDIHIHNPDVGRHKRYTISDVKFYIEEPYPAPATNRTRFRNIDYYTVEGRYKYSILDTRFLMKPGDLYSVDKYNRSQVQLTSMDIFRFVNINLDTTGGNMAVSVRTIKQKKYTLSDELGLILSQGAPGPYVNIGFKDRNPFGGFDILEFNARYSEEGQTNSFLLNTSEVYRSREISGNVSLTFPAIYFPWVDSRYLNSRNPKTRLLVGYTDINRPEYHRQIAKTSLTYLIQPNIRNTLGVSPFDVTLSFTPSKSPGFEDYLKRYATQSLIQSFNNSIVSGLSTYYIFNTIQSGVIQKSTYFRVTMEGGGALPTLIARNTGQSPDSLFDILQVFRYYRVNVEGRKYVPISKLTLLASRVNMGFSTPIAGSTSIPYEKFFFAGGSNSIRAWAPRRLGPGSFVQTDDDGNANYTYEQPGNILLEASVELRRKIFGFIEGAAFVDAGNVWRSKANRNFPGGDFRLNDFYRQIAVGTGLGLRLNFSFLIIRLDAGIKTYDPAQPNGSRWVIKNLTWAKPFGTRQQTVLNFGVGYPF